MAVIGGGDTAVEDALYLSRFAHVTLIHRRDRLRAMGAQAEKLRANKNVEMLLTTTVSAIERAGSGLLLRLSGDRALAVDGVFVAVGVEPQTKLVEGKLALDAAGYILAGEDTQTSVPGVFAAGDCRKKPLRQVSTAVRRRRHSGPTWPAPTSKRARSADVSRSRRPSKRAAAARFGRKRILCNIFPFLNLTIRPTGYIIIHVA